MNKSFTLIEILVVIVVIGVLSAFILVGMSSITNSANIAKGKVFINSIDNSLLLGRVSQWKLDESSGITAYDSWGSNNGTRTDTTGACDATHCPQIQTSGCVSNNCLLFDGSNDYVDCGSGASLNITNTPTISFWFKATSGSATILGKDWNQWRFYSNPLSIYNIRDGGNSSWATSWSYQNNTWYNVVWTNTGTQEILYINSVSQNSRTISGVLTSTGVFKVGMWGVGSDYFNGLTDDVRVYNQTIPTSEIQQNYFTGINKLFKNKGIALEEFNQRIVELKTNLAINKNTP